MPSIGRAWFDRPSLTAICLLAVPGVAAAADKLPALGADRGNVTVSGISSGGYMAGQFHVALSTRVDGVGIIAAGPYACARGSMSTALGQCVKGGVEVPPLIALARAAAQRQEIDPVDGLRNDRVWLFHGSADHSVRAEVVLAARDFYSAFAAPANIVYVDDIPVTHGVPTLTTGGECGKMGAPFLNACNYDAAGALLTSLLGKLESRTEAHGRLLAFDQAEFGDAELHATGYAYLPSACTTGPACRVHVFFHGCAQSAEVSGDTVARGAGFNEWAESNRLIVLYPQTRSSKLMPLNPLGCWDWWGYTDATYATRKGAQITAVAAMLDRLAAARTTIAPTSTPASH